MALKPSPRFALLLLLLHAIAAFVIFATAMPTIARLGVLMLILPSLFYYLARDALLFFPDSWREILFDQGRVSAVTLNGSGFCGKISGKTVVNPYFVVLCIRLEGRRLPVFRTIFPDALGTDAFRKLCVLLKYAQ